MIIVGFLFQVGAAQAQDVEASAPCSWLTAPFPRHPHTRPLADKIIAARLQKSEYETAAEFEARKEKSLEKLLPKDKHVWEGKLLGSEGGRYDAETRTLHYSEDDLLFMLHQGSSHRSLVVDVVNVKDTAQKMQNAFGVSVNASVKESVVYHLGYKEGSANGAATQPALSLAIPMDPGPAQNRWMLQFRFGGDVTGEVYTDRLHKSATLDSPREITEHKKLLVIENACGVIFDPFRSKPLATFSWPVARRPF